MGGKDTKEGRKGLIKMYDAYVVICKLVGELRIAVFVMHAKLAKHIEHIAHQTVCRQAAGRDRTSPIRYVICTEIPKALSADYNKMQEPHA